MLADVTHLFPINTAEAVVDPFWDPHLSTLPSYRITRHATGSVDVTQSWCYVQFGWERVGSGETAFTMRREIDCDVSRYDRIVVSMVTVKGSRVVVSVQGRGDQELSESYTADGEKHEYAVAIDGITHIASVEIRIIAGSYEGSGWLNWTALQHSGRLREHLHYLTEIAATIDCHIIDPPAPSFKPRYGLVFDDAELEALRIHAARIEPPRTEIEPERLVGDFILNAPDTRYSREREHGLGLLGRARSAAIYGFAHKDAALLKRAAKYAVAELLTPNWDWGVISRMPGSSFEIRSFMQEVILEDLVTTIDLAGEFLTPSAVEAMKRRMAEDGIGNINFVSWKHEYIHHMNQLPAFSSGRLAAYGLLLQSWPRVAPYLDLALADLVRSIEATVLPDGGFVEGPSYFHYTMSRSLTALRYYAHAVRKPFRDVVPDAILASRALAEALISTDAAQDHIPVCDAHATAPSESLASLASLMPDSMWTTMYRKRTGRESSALDPFELTLQAAIPVRGPQPKPFVSLPEMRLASSHRLCGDEPVKIVVLGNRAGAGHTHEDKGSFIIEYANSTIAMDPGICDYSHPLTAVLKHAQRHNMLVPIGTDERAHPDCPLGHHVDVEAEGDARKFRARIDCTPGWARYYRKWVREWVSDDPSTLIIRDTWELERGKGVAFLFNTVLPVSIVDRVAKVGTGAASVAVRCPGVDRVRVDEFPLPESDLPQRRISFEIDRPNGSLETTISFGSRT